MPYLDPKKVHLDPKIGLKHFKNMSISMGSKNWAMRPNIIHFLICFPEILQLHGHIGPKMPVLDPK